jgi:membrane protease YdiL (CAAX protease family)
LRNSFWRDVRSTAKGVSVLTDVIFVRKDWETVIQEMRWDQQRILIVVVTVMLLATAGVLVTLSWRIDEGIGAFASEALSYGLFFAVPVWYALRHRADGWRKAMTVYLLFMVVMLVNDCLIKGELHGELVKSPRAHQPMLYISVSMLLLWLSPLWIVRNYPIQARSIGLDFGKIGQKVLYGSLGAAILILHLGATLRYSELPLSLKPWPYVLFTFCYEVSAQSLSEEMFFRGFLFNYLYRVRQGRLWRTASLVSLLNVLIYLVKFRTSGSLYELFGLAFYVFVMAMMNTMFLWQGKGILPGVVLNVLFSMAVILR